MIWQDTCPVVFFFSFTFLWTLTSLFPLGLYLYIISNIPSLFIPVRCCFQFSLDSSILSFTLYLLPQFFSDSFILNEISSRETFSKISFLRLVIYFYLLFHNPGLAAIHQRWYSCCFRKFNFCIFLDFIFIMVLSLCHIFFETYLFYVSVSGNCAIWLWNMVSYIKGGMQAKGIWKQDPEVNIWAQEGREWGVEKAPQWGTS